MTEGGQLGIIVGKKLKCLCWPEKMKWILFSFGEWIMKRPHSHSRWTKRDRKEALSCAMKELYFRGFFGCLCDLLEVSLSLFVVEQLLREPPGSASSIWEFNSLVETLWADNYSTGKGRRFGFTIYSSNLCHVSKETASYRMKLKQ